MLKKTLLTLFVLCNLIGNAQSRKIKITVRSLYDSSSIESADLNLRNGKSLIKTLSGKTNTEGVAYFDIPENESFNLMITKDGFSSFYHEIGPNTTELLFYLKYLVYDGEEATVYATRTGNNNPTSHVLITKKELESLNFGQDLPILLQNTPSAVSSSDAGAGIGYTGIRIRGIDPSRINVTINGVPLNDAESQGVFWVNMPDFTSSVQDIQVQRGVGTSTNGAGAFGASINIKTDKYSEQPYAKLSYGIGSFNTNRKYIKLGTGKLPHNWYAEGRMSWINTDGFIDRAASNLNSYYLSIGKKSDKSLLQLNIFSGNEKTYQAWNGVPLVKFFNDSSEVDSLITYLYYDSAKAAQLRQGDPSKYNYYTYKNETDNYEQSHLQLIFNRNFKKQKSINLVFHHTLGKGYYENFETKTNLVNYMDTPVIHYGQAHYAANLIRQRWLDNAFSGVVFSFTSKKSFTDNTIGGAFNIYHGNHFGKVIWHEFINPENEGFNYYDNNSIKKEGSVYWKIQHKFSKALSGFSDLQLRMVDYSWFGPTSGLPAQQDVNYTFFNPKAGILYQPKSNQRFYLTYGRGSREPVRDDFINSSSTSQPKPEFMNNVEASYKSSRGDWNYTITAYYMGYKNQLALTGKINDVGGYTRINIPKSYRAGIEFEASLKIASWITWNWNLALSLNKIQKFTEYVDDYTNWGGPQKVYEWKNTDLALSPNRVIGSSLSIKANKNIQILFNTKAVERQYLDNTQTQSRSLEPYIVNDLIVQFTKLSKANKNSNIAFMINNIGNSNYASNGYTYSGMINDVRKDFSFVYPQAGINFLMRLELVF